MNNDDDSRLQYSHAIEVDNNSDIDHVLNSCHAATNHHHDSSVVDINCLSHHIHSLSIASHQLSITLHHINSLPHSHQLSIASHHITSTLYHTTSHHINSLSHHINSLLHHITSTLYHIISHQIIHHITPHHSITSHHITSNHSITSHHIISHPPGVLWRLHKPYTVRAVIAILYIDRYLIGWRCASLQLLQSIHLLMMPATADDDAVRKHTG